LFDVLIFFFFSFIIPGRGCSVALRTIFPGHKDHASARHIALVLFVQVLFHRVSYLASVVLAPLVVIVVIAIIIIS
jgi:hypothetical protein